MQCFRRSVLVGSLALASVGYVSAQTGLADVQGVVTDASDAVIAGAQVVLRNVDTGDTRTVKTGADGRYTFPQIAPGNYSISVTAAGFTAKTVMGVSLQLDNHLKQNISLAAGSETQTVDVTADVPVVDTTAYNVGGVIAQEQIDTLPIPNRQYLNLALLIPGTSQDANRSFYNNVQAGAGQYFFTTGFLLDGVSNQQTEEGDPRQNIPQGAVAEFKTYTASFPAELGWAMGGYVTVVTKSGTNQIHGEAFEYFRNSFMNANNQLQAATAAAQGTGKAPYNRNQYGFDIGGPIFKNRTHYFGAFEANQATGSYTLYVADPVARANYANLLGTFRTPNHDNMLLLRLDHNLTEKQQLFARYAQEWNLVSGNSCGGTTTIGCYDGQIPRHAIVVGHTWEPTSHLLNDTRFQYSWISYELGPWNTPVPKKPTDLLDPNYTKNVSRGYSFLSFGYGHTYAAVGVESRWELSEALTIQKGAHSFKLGATGAYVPYIDASASNLNGTYTFRTDQPFNPNDVSNLKNPYSFTQSAVPLLWYLPSTQEAFFFQDSWKLRPTLTFNYGIRYERQFGAPFLDTFTPNPAYPVIPQEGDPHKRGDRNNFSPRLGMSWDPFGKSRDVIRAGYGVYHNFIQTELSEGEKTNFKACSISIVSATNNAPFPDPYQGKSVSSYCSTAAPNVTILDQGMSNPYQHQFSAGYTHDFGHDLSLTADGIYAHALRDYRTYDQNYPLNYPASSVRPVTYLAQVNSHVSAAQSKYKAMYLKLDKRFAHRYMYAASYTLSSGYDNNPHGTVTTYSNPKLDYGPASIDRRHAVIVSGSALIPGKILVGGIFSYRSALPFSVTTTTTSSVLPASMLNANGTAQYVPGTSRNQGNRGISYTAINAYRASVSLAPVSQSDVQSTNLVNFDLRLSRSFFQSERRKLEVIGQAFNLFGRNNYTSITTSPNSAAFGKATAARDAQIGELAVRFTF